MDVRPCCLADHETYAATVHPYELPHHEQRWLQHRRRELTYLIAWEGTRPLGHVAVLNHSKYEAVIADRGEFPELSSLAALVQGSGVGTALVNSAEAHCRALGASHVGLAVAHGNPSARRLYERLGYVEWSGGPVIDRWLELGASGSTVREHTETCAYLVKDIGDLEV